MRQSGHFWQKCRKFNLLFTLKTDPLVAYSVWLIQMKVAWSPRAFAIYGIHSHAYLFIYPFTHSANISEYLPFQRH